MRGPDAQKSRAGAALTAGEAMADRSADKADGLPYGVKSGHNL